MPTYTVATHKRYVFGPFACEACGHEDQAAIFVRSQASQQHNLVDGWDESADLAHGSAHGGAEESGDEQIALSPCPRCGQRDELAQKNFRRKGNGPLGAGIAFAAFALLGAGFVLAQGGESFFVVAALVFFGTPAVILLPIGLFRRFRKIPATGVVFRSVDPRLWDQLPTT